MKEPAIFILLFAAALTAIATKSKDIQDEKLRLKFIFISMPAAIVLSCLETALGEAPPIYFMVSIPALFAVSLCVQNNNWLPAKREHFPQCLFGAWLAGMYLVPFIIWFLGE
jgi:hypothetical protein